MHKSLFQYAGTIKRNWSNLSPHAKPYVDAMYQLDQITDNYGADSGRSIVLYFLSNAKEWRGEIARNTKSELKAIAGVK